MTRHHRLLGPIKAAARALQIRRAINDPALRRKVTPSDELGCKRIMLTDDWYPTLTRAQRRARTDARIERIGPRASARRRPRAPRPTCSCSPPASASHDFVAPLEIDGPRGDARRRRGRRPARLPRRHRARLPEPLPALRPEHQRRHRLGGGDDRVLDAPRAGRAGASCAAPAPHDRGPPRGRRGLRRRAARGAATHRLAHGLHELVRRRARQRPQPVAVVVDRRTAAAPPAWTRRPTRCPRAAGGRA